jgi:hypothetical protein
LPQGQNQATGNIPRRYSLNLCPLETQKANTGGKAVLPHWGELFNKIRREEFPEYILHNDPDMRKLDDEVFPNI